MIFLDETDLLLFPPLRAAWMLRGQPERVVISGWNDKRVVFGALNILTGTRLFQVRDRQKEVDFAPFLRQIRYHYRGWRIILVLDEHPSHTAKGSKRLARSMGMKLVWLPKRSPKLNPVDTLWGQAKDVVTPNYQYEDIDDSVERFVEHLEGLSNLEALRTIGALNSNFWLYQ
jgi:transposase